MISKIREGIKYLLETPEANSRFIYLCQGLASVLGMLAVTVGFIFAKNKDGYDLMVLAVGGGSGAAASWGRYMVKKAGNSPETQNGATS